MYDGCVILTFYLATENHGENLELKFKNQSYSHKPSKNIFNQLKKSPIILLNGTYDLEQHIVNNNRVQS